MATKLFIGKLSFNTTEETLSELFKEYGELTSLSIIKDKETNRSRGFAFVEMSDDEAAKKAINGLNNKEVDDRTIVVSVALSERCCAFAVQSAFLPRLKLKER